MPKGRGLWPAFWLLPRDGGTAEIDVMEILGDDPGTVYQTVHAGASQHTTYRAAAFDASTSYHTYAVLWDEDGVAFFVDGAETGRFTATIRGAMYLLANLQVGADGSWPGAPNSATAFPARFRIAFIRVYRNERTACHA